MQRSKERKYPIPFHNDVFLRYMLIDENTGSVILRNRIIEEIYGLKVQETQMLNPELLPKAFFGRRAVLDVVLEDEAGHLYDLEMQVSGYTKEEQLCFQQCGYRLADGRLKQGNDYAKLRPLCQVIFTNCKPKDTGHIIRHYTVKDGDNREEPNGTLHHAIMFLSIIRQRVKKVGGIENLTEFGTFCYVLAYSPDDAILDMKRGVVNMAMKKYDGMREDSSLYSWAEPMEFAQHAVQTNLEEQTAETEKSGLGREFKQGPQKGLDEGKRTLLQSLIVHKYGIEDEWVGSLPGQQMDDAVIQILGCDTCEALKERLKNKGMK